MWKNICQKNNLCLCKFEQMKRVKHCLKEWDKFLEFYPWGKCIMLLVVGPGCEGRKLLPFRDKIHLSAQSEVSELQDSWHNKQWAEKVHSSAFLSEIINCNNQHPLPETDGKSPGKSFVGIYLPLKGIQSLWSWIFSIHPQNLMGHHLFT